MVDRWVSRELLKWLLGTPHQLRNILLDFHLWHLIYCYILSEGGIFWCYGLLSFARFLGAFADRGWAWNKSPLLTTYSAEFVESLVIFGYGISNTWMERFGVESGDPYTTKQIQHVSIAVTIYVLINILLCFIQLYRSCSGLLG